MRGGAVVVSCALAVALSGCFTADKPLLNDANSVAPYATITFREQHATDATKLTRNGKAYTSPTSNGTLTVRFMPIERANWYLTEISIPDSSGVALLYGVIHVDPASKHADAFKTVGDPKDVRPGLRMCKDYICIDDVKAYIAYAEAYADGGAPPDANYEISVE